MRILDVTGVLRPMEHPLVGAETTFRQNNVTVGIIVSGVLSVSMRYHTVRSEDDGIHR